MNILNLFYKKYLRDEKLRMINKFRIAINNHLTSKFIKLRLSVVNKQEMDILLKDFKRQKNHIHKVIDRWEEELNK